MIRLGFAIRNDGSIPSGRRFAEVRRAVYQAMAEAWAQRFLARHFQTGASGRYGYKARSKSTRQRKMRKHRPYLVETGELEAMALATAPYGIKAAPNYVKLSIDTPPYITQHRQGDEPDYAAEVFATIPAEEAEIMQLGESVAEQMLQANREPKTTTIG